MKENTPPNLLTLKLFNRQKFMTETDTDSETDIPTRPKVRNKLKMSNLYRKSLTSQSFDPLMNLRQSFVLSNKEHCHLGCLFQASS